MTEPQVVGVPRELKEGEHRVAITPDGVHELTVHDVPVLIERDAGAGSSISDDDFRAVGAEIVPTADDVWGRADLVLKVKEPQVEELDLLRPGLVLFTYLHLAAYPAVADALLEHKVTGIAYETVQVDDGRAPVAGADERGRRAGWRRRWARTSSSGSTAAGACCSAARPASGPARVVVLGAGNVGWNAAWIAQGMEAEVLLLDRNLDRLRWVDQIHRGRIMTLASNRLAVERAVADADLVIGAVLVPGGRAPVVVTARHGARRCGTGSVIVDCAIDQGGCVEGIHETSHADPVYEVARCAALRRRQHPRRGAAHVDVRAHQRDAAVRRSRSPPRGWPTRPRAIPSWPRASTPRAARSRTRRWPRRWGARPRRSLTR